MDSKLQQLFDDCFNWSDTADGVVSTVSVATGVVATEAQCRAQCRVLQRMITAKTMRSRVKYFCAEMMRRLRDKIDQAQGTRPKLQGKKGKESATGSSKSKPSQAVEKRQKRRKAEDNQNK